MKILRQEKKTNEGRRDHLDVSFAFGDQTYKYRIRIALTLICSCVHGQIYSCYFLQAKLGHHKVKDVRKGFELKIYCLIVHV